MRILPTWAARWGTRRPAWALDATFWTSVTLALLLSAELVRVLRLLAMPMAGSTVPAAPPSAAPLHPFDAARIVRAHVFGEPPPTGDSATATHSLARLVLSGTMATGDPTIGLAILGEPGQPEVLAVGDAAGTATLRFVYADRVILERNGALEAVDLPKAITGVDLHTPRTQTAAQTPAEPIADGGGRTTPAERLADVADAIDARGRFLGVRVAPGSDVAKFIHSGLVSGDVIVAIDGTTIGTPGQGGDAWRQTRNGSSVTVMRHGRPQQLTLNLEP